MPKKERKLGIDLLRIISMLMIVTLHVLLQGGILNNTKSPDSRYFAAWTLEAFCIGAVNCYALISGYVGVNSKIKYHKIAVLWLQVVFFCVLFAIIFKSTIKPDKAFVTWFNTFFPVYNRAYWYFTAYFVLFFFTPYINVMLNNLSKKQLKGMGWVIFIFFALLQTIWQNDVLHTKFGYSFLWLTLLYILGGIIKKTEYDKKANSALMMFGFIFFSALSAGYKFAAEQWHWKVVKDYMINYTSATTFIATFCLFVFFAKLDIKSNYGKAFVKLLSPYTFGVYIIHTNAFIWTWVLKDLFKDYVKSNTFTMMLAVFGTVITIYLVCTVIEVCRVYLFKLLHIEPALAALENKIRNRKKKEKAGAE